MESGANICAAFLLLRRYRRSVTNDLGETPMEHRPVIALLYDFDKTLCTTDMQNYAFIPSLGMTPGEFWAEANSFGHEMLI